jgi:hypothetical protein
VCSSPVDIHAHDADVNDSARAWIVGYGRICRKYLCDGARLLELLKQVYMQHRSFSLSYQNLVVLIKSSLLVPGCLRFRYVNLGIRVGTWKPGYTGDPFYANTGELSYFSLSVFPSYGLSQSLIGNAWHERVMHFYQATSQRVLISILFAGYGPLPVMNPVITCAYHFKCTTTNRRLLHVFFAPAHSFVTEARHSFVQTYKLVMVHKSG